MESTEYTTNVSTQPPVTIESIQEAMAHVSRLMAEQKECDKQLIAAIEDATGKTLTEEQRGIVTRGQVVKDYAWLPKPNVVFHHNGRLFALEICPERREVSSVG